MPYEVESKGWHYLSGKDALVRDDIWNALQKELSDKEICGTKFSIVFQWKETSPMCCSNEVERYNLFVKKYDDVAGPLHHPFCEGESREEYKEQVLGNRKNKMPKNIPMLTFYEWITLGEYEVNDYGDFRRSFESLEEAKEYAVRRGCGRISKNIF